MLGIAGGVLWPTDAAGYNARLVAVADGTMSAMETLVLAYDADTFSPFRRVLVEDARDDVATAQYDLTREEPPDEVSAQARDDLVSLLAEASSLVSDPDPIESHHDQLRDLGVRLNVYLERHQ